MATDFELALMSYKAYGQSDANKVEMASWTEKRLRIYFCTAH